MHESELPPVLPSDWCRTPRYRLMHRSRLSWEVCFSVRALQSSSAPSAADGSPFRIFNGDKELLDSHRRGKQRYRGQEGARHSDIHQEAAERWRIQAGEGSRDPGFAVSPLPLTGMTAAGVIRDVWDVFFLDNQHSSGGWKLRLQSMALGLGGWARFLRSSSRPRVLLSRENAVLYFLSNAAAGRERERVKSYHQVYFCLYPLHLFLLFRIICVNHLSTVECLSQHWKARLG